MADKRTGKTGEKEEKMEETKEKSIDDIYRYDEEAITAQRKAKPWENESAHLTSPHHITSQQPVGETQWTGRLTCLHSALFYCWSASNSSRPAVCQLSLP